MHRAPLRQLVALLPLVLAACSGSGEARDASTDARPIGYDGAPPSCFGTRGFFMGEPTLPLELGRSRGDTFEPWADGQEVPFVWGTQGGTMIVPTARASASLDASTGDTACVLLEVENLEPDGGTVFASYRGFMVSTPAGRDGDVLEIRGFYDQLGNTEFPRGTPLDLVVTLRGSEAAARGRVRLSIVPDGPVIPPQCEALPVTGSGCRYRTIPAMGRVTRFEAAAAAEPSEVCSALPADPLIVEYELVLGEGYEECATHASSAPRSLFVAGYLVPRACADDAGLALGSTFPIDYQEIIGGGTCSPVLSEVHALDDTNCAERCIGTR